MNKLPSPRDLDRQSPITITKWLDLHSDECKDMDPDHDLTIKWFKMLQGDVLSVDSDGRIWGKGSSGNYYPYHFDYGKQQYGYRIAKLAAN